MRHVIKAAMLVALLSTAQSDGAVLVNSGLDGTAVSDISNGTGKAVGFALGTTGALGVDNYKLDDIQVRLKTDDITSANNNSVFALYSSTTSGDRKPSALITLFSDPVVSTVDATNYTLAPLTPVTLQPGTTYWIVGYNTSTSANDLQWLVSGAAATTTAPGITVGSGTGSFPAGWVASTSGSPITFSTKSSFYNDLVVNGSVPEPTSVAAVAGLVMLAAGRRRR